MNLQDLIKATLSEDEIVQQTFDISDDLIFIDNLSNRQVNALGIFLYSMFYGTPSEIGIDVANIKFEDFTRLELKEMVAELCEVFPDVLDTIALFLSDPLDPEEILDNIEYDIETGTYSEFDAEEFIDNYNYACDLAQQATAWCGDEIDGLCEELLDEGPSVIIGAKDRAERRKKKVYGQKVLGQKSAAASGGKIKTMAMVRAFRARNKAKRIASGQFRQQKQYRAKFKAKLSKRAQARNALKAKGQWTVTHHKGFKPKK